MQIRVGKTNYKIYADRVNQDYLSDDMVKAYKSQNMSKAIML